MFVESYTIIEPDMVHSAWNAWWCQF